MTRTEVAKLRISPKKLRYTVERIAKDLKRVGLRPPKRAIEKFVRTKGAI